MSILTNKIDALSTVPEQWAVQIMKFQPKLLTRLNQLASKLTLTSDGFLEMSASNLNVISEIMEGLKSYMTSGEYKTIVQELDKQFVAQEARTIAYFQSTFGSAPVTSFASTLYNVQRLRMLETVIGDGLYPVLYTPIRDVLLDGIASGSSYSDLIDNLSRLSVGDEQLEGRLARYTRVLVSDTLATTDRQFTQIVGDELGLEWFRYLGGLINTTRCFCLERNGGYYHRREIELWGDLVGIGDCTTKNGWQGRFRGTNSETIFSWVGGYNCQHSLIPISEASVPKSDLILAIEKGYYKPDEATKKALGLSVGGGGVKVGITNNSGIDIDTKAINTHARLKAKEYGLKDGFDIDIVESDNVGGGVNFKRISPTVSKFENKIEIFTDGTLTKTQYNQIINHELRHVQQGQVGKMLMKRNSRGSWDIYWDGKKYMSASAYEKLTKRITNSRLSFKARAEAFKKYENLPWEKEAFDNDGRF